MDLSPRGVRAIAEAGYVFLFPLVANYWVMYSEAIDPSSPTFAGGFGRWTHCRRATSHETDIASTHVTTLHSSAWLDVRAEPWVITIPSRSGDRTTVVTDLWGMIVDESGAGSDDHLIVVAGETWVGAIPADAALVVRPESPFVRCETSVRIAAAVDPESAREIRSACRMEPLSHWSTGPSAPAAPAIAWWPVDAETFTAMAFWPAATFALGLTTRHDEDRGILDRLTEIGVVPGTRWDEHDRLADLYMAIEEGMDDALTELMRASTDTGDHTPNRRTRSETDRDYFGRALAALRLIPLIGLSS